MTFSVRLALLSAALWGSILPGAATAASLLPGTSGKEPYKIDANKLDYFEKEQRMIYTGDVIAEQGATKMRCSVMAIYLEKGEDGEEQVVKRVEMKGPVTILQKDKIGVGDDGIYDRAKNAWYLNGNVTLTQGADVTKGDVLIYDLGTQRAQVHSSGGNGRVTSTFVPKGEKDKK